MTTAFQSGAFQANAFQIDAAASVGGGGSGKRYGKHGKYNKGRLKGYYTLQPWEAPKVRKKIEAVEKKKAKVETEMADLRVALQATADRLALARIKESFQRLTLQIEVMRADLNALHKIYVDLEAEEAQLILLIASLHE